MHLQKFNRILPSFLPKNRSLTSLPNEEYTETPQYPPILRLDRNAKKERATQEWSKQIQNCKTVEEKQMKLNMPKYYGWKCTMLNDVSIPYNSMSFVQHCTRTHFKEVPHLPDFYNNIDVEAATAELKSSIEELLKFEHSGMKRSNEIYKQKLDKAVQEDALSNSIVQQINRVIINSISASNSQLLDTEVDLSPRHEAFWFVGGIYPPENTRKSREQFSWAKEFAEEPVNRAVQYLGTPSLALRHELPLEPIVPYSEADNPDLEVPFFDFDPKVLGFNTAHRHGTNIPGFWPGDPHEFGLLSYQNRGHILNRSPNFGPQDNLEALHCQGMLSSFAWLLSQASFQGFTTYNDLTYPLVAQTIVTNGREFSFYAYQLNTVLMHSDFINSNTKRNICFGTRPEKLFEKIEDGQIIGFNENVLMNLLKFYSNVPKVREGVEMKPFLNQSESIVADIVDDDKRNWLEKQYKHMMSNRPKHREIYEVYHWEKIYKIDNNTRVMEPRRRHFELGTNPWKRTYDDRSPTYIPKALRPGGPKSKPKFYKNYFP